MPRRNLEMQTAILAWTICSLTTVAFPAQADSVSLGAISEATRVSHPFPPPGASDLSPGPFTMLQVGLDGRVPLRVDSAVEFDLASIPQGAMISSATLWLTVAGTQSSLASPALNVTGFGSNNEAVQLASFGGSQ